MLSERPTGETVSISARASEAHRAESKKAAAGRAKASNNVAAPGVTDDDDEETWLERITNSEAVRRLTALSDRIFQNYFVAVLFDVLGVLLFMFDIWTDALVVDALSQTEHLDWMVATLVFILWHYVLMAVLVSAYLKRTTTKLNVLGLEEGDSAVGGSAVLGSGRRHRWLLFVPVALPGVVLLDIAMLFTSILPIMFPRAFANFSSFLSNYNFSRFFIEFVFESIPQTILQTYIYHQLAKGHLAGSAQQRTVAMSLTVSCLNCIKYGWKLYKAADDAGLTLAEYFKYLLLLKGNYECSPSAMIAVINECCAVRKEASLAAAARGGGGGGATAGGAVVGVDGNETVFIMNGFHLHRNKSQYGPAQQAYILLNAFDRMDGSSGVRRWVVSGCPLASMNRILEKGIRAFRNLTTLEVNECALRGDTWKLVTRAIKRHKRLEKVKLIQTGILPKYRNAKRSKVVAGLFKHSLRLRTVALCLHWWDEAYLQEAAELYLLNHPTLESLAIELPAGAAFAARDLAADPRAGAEPHHHGHHREGGRHSASYHKPALDPIGEASIRGGGSSNSNGGAPSPGAHPPRGRVGDGASSGGRSAGGGLGAPGFSRIGSASGAAAGFLSPFATDASAAAAAAGCGRRFSTSGGGIAGSASGGSISGAVLGWIQYGSDVLSDAASYISDGTVSTMQGLAAVATGRHWSDSGAASAAASGGGRVASSRYCWLLASLMSSAPALQSLYIHNHALPPSAAEGVGQLAAALAGNTRLTALSLRGSTVGDAGAASFSRVLAGHNSCLRSLNLRRCQLHDEGIAALCSCLVENRGLRTLDLSHNRVQGLGVGAAALGPGVAASVAATTCAPHPSHHPASRLAGLERALRLNSSLTELRLEGWRDTFDDPHAVSVLAAALAANQGLRSLSLAGCCVSNAGAAALAAALAANATLTSLNLNAQAADAGPAAAAAAAGPGGGGGGAASGGPEGRIGDAGCGALGAALARNRTLLELYVCGCSCGQQGGAALGEALRLNGVLQLLDLSGDGLVDGGMGAAAAAAGCDGGHVDGTGRDWTAATGTDDAAATSLFMALQSNISLRVLRIRGARGLSLRCMRAAGEMLRRNICLEELDLSSSSFLTAADSPSAVMAERADRSGPYSQHGNESGLLPRPPSLRSLPSLPSARSIPPLPSQSSLQPSSPATKSLASSPRAASAGGYSAAAEVQAPSRRFGSFASGLARIGSIGGRLSAHAGASTSGGGGGSGCLDGTGDARLGEDAQEVLGALWSALAGGLASNGSLRVLRLAYCGLGSVGAAALAPALAQNGALLELDLSGLPAAVARTQLAGVIAQAVAAAAVAVTVGDARGGGGESRGAVAADKAGGGVAGGGGCALVSILATDEDYEVVDLLGADKVTSRAAEEAAAAVEAAMRAPGGRSASRRALLGGSSGEGSSGAGDGPGWRWSPWRR